MGVPIAGCFLQAGGGTRGSGTGQSISVYQRAISNTVGMANSSAPCVLVARQAVASKFRKKV
jgi:hypothetical protein